MGGMRNANKILISSIRLDLRGIDSESVDWMHLSEDRDRFWAVVNLCVP